MTDFFFYICWPCLQAEGFAWSDVLLGVDDALLCLVSRCNESRLEGPISLSRFEGEPKVPSQAPDS